MEFPSIFSFHSFFHISPLLHSIMYFLNLCHSCPPPSLTSFKAQVLAEDVFNSTTEVRCQMAKETKRDNYPHNSNEEYFRRAMFIPCLDVLISGLVWEKQVTYANPGVQHLSGILCSTVLANQSIAGFLRRNIRGLHLCFQDTLGHLKPHSSEGTQAEAVVGVIRRLIPARAHEFNITVNMSKGPRGKDTFQVLKLANEDQVAITGTSGVAAAWGFHHYLKYHCLCHVSWEADQLNLPAALPAANITVTSADRFRYYQNVCTSSYSFTWWNWTRWEREIDWMALNGINLALATVGQEAIWERVYLQLNLTSDDINNHFTGPAFLAWGRMGNIRGWAGPLSPSWHNHTLILQRRILARMRELGIVPILPAFAGHVPRAFQNPYLIEPTEPLFRHVGNLFMEQVIAEFGTDHVYNCDTFNEMVPRSGELDYLSAVGHATFQAMIDIDPTAIWVKQSWEFLHSPFWTIKRVKSFLTSVPIGRMLVLDLQSEQYEQYTTYSSYFGQPFIWCMLHNFGGTLGLFGSMNIINQKVFVARALTNGTMVGTGLTPEGINQNYVIYDLMTEMSWRTEPTNLTQWVSAYATRRYGEERDDSNQAWDLLKAWFNVSDVVSAWYHLLAASPHLESVPTFQHDLVDVTRQVLQNLGTSLYVIIVDAYRSKNISSFQNNAALMLDLLADLDNVLSSNRAFLLGTWLEAAKALATTPLVRHQCSDK
uniref:Alpha-N-acetylglucosaminidase n=1 Tax=Timema monikensis TaxID=170555 RepID=A0A7R9HLL6_9NEOP|nr:unnamed protein product [Timema monikensis]